MCSPSPPCILLRCISHHRLSAPCGPGEVATLCTVMSSASFGGSKSPRKVGPHNPQSDARLLEEEEAPGRARAQFIQFCLLGRENPWNFELLPSLLRRRRWRRRWRWWWFLTRQILVEGAKKQPEHTALYYFHRLPSADHSLVVELNKIPACPRPP